MNLTRHERPALFHPTREMIYWAYIDTLCKKAGTLAQKICRRWHFVLSPIFHTAIWNCMMKMTHHIKLMTPVSMVSLDNQGTITTNSIQVSLLLIWRNFCGMNITMAKERSGTITLSQWGWSLTLTVDIYRWLIYHIFSISLQLLIRLVFHKIIPWVNFLSNYAEPITDFLKDNSLIKSNPNGN